MSYVDAQVEGVIRRFGPITLRDIARMTHLSRRDCEQAVQELRLRGEPIIDDGTLGLRFTDDPDELASYLRSRRERARTILRAARPLRETERRLRQRDMVLGL
jgi:hypothetical protein